MLVLRMMIIGEWWCFPSTGVSATDSVMEVPGFFCCGVVCRVYVWCVEYCYGPCTFVRALSLSCLVSSWCPIWYDVH